MKFDLVYEELLAELFNTKQQTKWSYYDGGYTTFLEGPGGISYLLSLAPFWDVALPPEIYNFKEITPENWNTLQEGAWHVEFVSEDTEDSDDEDTNTLIGITGSQGADAAKVFSLVGNALIDKMKAEPDKFRSIVFQAKEPSRRKLYSRLTPLLAKKLNKDYVISADGEWFFILSKN